MRQSHSPDDGFTLVELLVSLALLSLMAIYALNALSSLRSINRVVDRTSMQMEVEAVIRHFRETLADTRPLFVTDENNVPRLIFKGKPDSLEFVSASNGDRETGGLYLVRFRLDAEGVLVAERDLLRSRMAGGATKTVLLRNVDSLSFKYISSAPVVPQIGITDTWQRNDILPTTIEVSVGFNTQDTRIWPVTLVELKTAR